MWQSSFSRLARQNKPLQKPTIMYLSKKEGISNQETWVNVRSLLQTTVHNSLEDDEPSLSSVVYSKYPLWVFADIDDSDWLWLSFKCLLMKVVSVMMELQDFETHLNLVKDFTGSRARMSSTTSSGTSSRIVVVVWGLTLLSVKKWNAGRTRRHILYMCHKTHTEENSEEKKKRKERWRFGK